MSEVPTVPPGFTDEAIRSIVSMVAVAELLSAALRVPITTAMELYLRVLSAAAAAAATPARIREIDQALVGRMLEAASKFVQ